jgi:hypothetical protein
VLDARGFEGRGSWTGRMAMVDVCIRQTGFVYAFLAVGGCADGRTGLLDVSILVHYSNCICMYVMYV